MPRALILDGPRRLRVVPHAVDPALPGAGLVGLTPVAVGVCGSDVHGYLGHSTRRPAGTVMGHEIAARVQDASSPLDGRLVALDPVVRCGRCPACRAGDDNRCSRRRLFGCTPELPGGFAEAMRAPADSLVPVPAGLDPVVVSQCEPLAVALHATARAPVAGHRVVVVGAGAIGVTVALMAVHRGAADVVVSESSPGRRRLTAELGLSCVAPELVEAGAAQVALDCAGHSTTLNAALHAVAPGGTVVCVGLARPQTELAMAELVMDERTLIGSAIYTHSEFVAAAALLAELQPSLARMVSRRATLDELPAVFEDYAQHIEPAVKTTMVVD